MFYARGRRKPAYLNIQTYDILQLVRCSVFIFDDLSLGAFIYIFEVEIVYFVLGLFEYSGAVSR